MSLRGTVELTVPALREVATALEEALSEDVPEGGGLPLADKFRLPMKNLDKEWYEASQRYGPYAARIRSLMRSTFLAFLLLPHPALCADWNLESGGDTDLGEPLVAPFSGLVLSARNWGGSVGQVVQMLGVTGGGEVIVWAGWHLQGYVVDAGQFVRMGEPVGAIGNAGGYYRGAAHLHEQICVVNALGIPRPDLFAGSDRRYGWQSPPVFYVQRGVDPDLVARCVAWRG